MIISERNMGESPPHLLKVKGDTCSLIDGEFFKTSPPRAVIFLKENMNDLVLDVN